MTPEELRLILNAVRSGAATIDDAAERINGERGYVDHGAVKIDIDRERLSRGVTDVGSGVEVTCEWTIHAAICQERPGAGTARRDIPPWEAPEPSGDLRPGRVDDHEPTHVGGRGHDDDCAGFTDDAQDLAGHDVEGNAVDGSEHVLVERRGAVQHVQLAAVPCRCCC